MITETTEILSDEHKNILKMIDKIEDECNDIEQKEEMNKEFFKSVVDFIRNYADKLHHAKEEDILFKKFDECNEMGCNPIQQMLYEHDLGRNFVKGIEEGINEDNKKKIIENARDYCNLLKDHIFKEDNVLYPMAEEAIDEKTKEKMIKKFKEINKERKKDIDKYLAMIKIHRE